jgi:catechol 2,3-dioxygenase-like lactoylglutathione lyase family enzyme
MMFTANRDIAIGVENLRKSSKFYEETLGLRPVEKGLGRVVYDAGHLTLYIMEGELHLPVLSFTVEDLGAAKQRLLEGGCDIVDEREDSIYFSDPSGVVFDTIQPK